MIIKQLKKTKIKISEQLSLWFSEEYEKNEVDTSMIFYESRDGKNGSWWVSRAKYSVPTIISRGKNVCERCHAGAVNK